MATETFVVSSSGKASIVKDPGARLDYTFDWSAWLAAVSGDTIVSADCVVVSDGSQGVSDVAVAQVVLVGGTAVTVWVTGGLVGETVSLRCRITTALSSPGPRIDDRTVYLKIKER